MCVLLLVSFNVLCFVAFNFVLLATLLPLTFLLSVYVVVSCIARFLSNLGSCRLLSSCILVSSAFVLAFLDCLGFCLTFASLGSRSLDAFRPMSVNDFHDSPGLSNSAYHLFFGRSYSCHLVAAHLSFERVVLSSLSVASALTCSSLLCLRPSCNFGFLITCAFFDFALGLVVVGTSVPLMCMLTFALSPFCNLFRYSPCDGQLCLLGPLSVIALAADMISLWLQCMFAFHCLLLFPHVSL